MTQNPPTNIVLVHSEQYANWIFDPTHPTQGRRFINARNQLVDSFGADKEQITEVAPRLATRAELERLHAPSYVDEILIDHTSGQWTGARPDLATLASTFVGGTLTALEMLISKKAHTAIHFPGAKHHAQFDYSSGFCIFNDFAIAADIATKDHGLKVAILDIDAHHGDGTENLTSDNPMVLTYSIHEKGIFPGTGNSSTPEKFAYNYPLGDQDGEGDIGKGDEALLKGIADFGRLADEFNAELIFIAAGADGHAEDPLSSLQFTIAGYTSVAKHIRKLFPNTPILVGGAGGYLPDTRTPEAWAVFCREIIKN